MKILVTLNAITLGTILVGCVGIDAQYGPVTLAQKVCQIEYNATNWKLETPEIEITGPKVVADTTDTADAVEASFKVGSGKFERTTADNVTELVRFLDTNHNSNCNAMIGVDPKTKGALATKVVDHNNCSTALFGALSKLSSDDAILKLISENSCTQAN